MEAHQQFGERVEEPVLGARDTRPAKRTR